MASELLKKIAAGEEFDIADAIREVARMLVADAVMVSGAALVGGTVTSAGGISEGAAELGTAGPKPAAKKK